MRYFCAVTIQSFTETCCSRIAMSLFHSSPQLVAFDYKSSEFVQESVLDSQDSLQGTIMVSIFGIF